MAGPRAGPLLGGSGSTNYLFSPHQWNNLGLEFVLLKSFSLATEGEESSLTQREEAHSPSLSFNKEAKLKGSS